MPIVLLQYDPDKVPEAEVRHIAASSENSRKPFVRARDGR